MEIIGTPRPWYGEDGESRSNLAAILSLYGFSLIETVTHPEKKAPGSAGISQGSLFDDD